MAVFNIESEYLNISQVIREDMGAYLCIASNGIQPAVSKRISIQVNCKYGANGAACDNNNKKWRAYMN